MILLFAIVAVIVPVAALADVPSDEEIVAALKTKAPPEKLEYLLGLERGTERDATIYFQLGNTYFGLGELDSAVVNYNLAVEEDPQHFKAYVNLGIAYDEKGQTSPAQAAYKKALEIRPEDVLAHCHLGYNLVRQGRVNEGLKYYKRALEIDPNSPQAHYNLGLAFADLKVFAEAIREWLVVVELDPGGDLGKTAAENVELIKAYLAVEP